MSASPQPGLREGEAPQEQQLLLLQQQALRVGRWLQHRADWSEDRRALRERADELCQQSLEPLNGRTLGGGGSVCTSNKRASTSPPCCSLTDWQFGGGEKPEWEAENFIAQIIEDMWCVWEDGDVHVTVVWPMKLRSSATCRGGLGDSGLTELLLRVDLKEGVVKRLHELWSSSDGETHAAGCKVYCEGTPTMVTLVLMEALREAATAQRRARRCGTVCLTLTIREWPNDEPTEKPACSVFQNLLSAVSMKSNRSHSNVLPLASAHIQLCSCESGERSKARVELERLALKLPTLAADQGASCRLDGITSSSYELVGKGEQVTCTLELPLPNAPCQPGTGSLYVSHSPKGREVGVVVRNPAEARDVSKIFKALRTESSTFRISMPLCKCESQQEEDEYCEPMRETLGQLMPIAPFSKISVEVGDSWQQGRRAFDFRILRRMVTKIFASVRSCPPSMRLLLEFVFDVVLDQVEQGCDNEEESLASALKCAPITTLIFKTKNVSDPNQITIKAALEGMVNGACTGNLHLQCCKWINIGKDGCPQTAVDISPCELHQNQQLALQIETWKQFKGSLCNLLHHHSSSFLAPKVLWCLHAREVPSLEKSLQVMCGQRSSYEQRAASGASHLVAGTL